MLILRLEISQESISFQILLVGFIHNRLSLVLTPGVNILSRIRVDGWNVIPRVVMSQLVPKVKIVWWVKQVRLLLMLVNSLLVVGAIVAILQSIIKAGTVLERVRPGLVVVLIIVLLFDYMQLRIGDWLDEMGVTLGIVSNSPLIFLHLMSIHTYSNYINTK